MKLFGKKLFRMALVAAATAAAVWAVKKVIDARKEKKD